MSIVLTIGHSNQPAPDFIALLTKHNISLVVDVRSRPRSRFGHFNRNPLCNRLLSLGLEYLYLGDELGGHPDQEDLYADGRVAYERVVLLPEFRRGIKRVIRESQLHRLVLMCVEEDPLECHRHPLLALVLLQRGVHVLHIRRDGSVQDAKALMQQTGRQMPLVEPVGEDFTWRSPKRIRRREPT